MTIRGRAHVYGDDVDTDRIIPGKYTKTLDLTELAAHAMEDLDPEFRTRMRRGDLVVGGHNFGCGSSREQAPLALKAVGVSAIVARSFARIFYRNAINIGLPVVEVDDPAAIASSGDELAIDLAAGEVHNLTSGRRFGITPLPAVMQSILDAGGLVPYLAKHGTY